MIRYLHKILKRARNRTLCVHMYIRPYEPIPRFRSSVTLKPPWQQTKLALAEKKDGRREIKMRESLHYEFTMCASSAATRSVAYVMESEPVSCVFYYTSSTNSRVDSHPFFHLTDVRLSMVMPRWSCLEELAVLEGCGELRLDVTCSDGTLEAAK